MHEIDEENYPKLVEGSDKVFILKAGATWCAPCTASRGPFTELAEELKDKFSLGEMDIDKSPNLGSKLFYKIGALILQNKIKKSLIENWMD